MLISRLPIGSRSTWGTDSTIDNPQSPTNRQSPITDQQIERIALLIPYPHASSLIPVPPKPRTLPSLPDRHRRRRHGWPLSPVVGTGEADVARARRGDDGRRRSTPHGTRSPDRLVC